MDDLAARFDPQVAARIKDTAHCGAFASLLGLRVEDVTPGRIVCSMAVEPTLFSPMGVMHGGALAALVDHTLSLAVYPLMKPGMWAATTEFKVNYLDAVREGVLRATARVLSLRPRIAVVAVDVENEARLVATALGTLYLREKPTT